MSELFGDNFGPLWGVFKRPLSPLPAFLNRGLYGNLFRLDSHNLEDFDNHELRHALLDILFQLSVFKDESSINLALDWFHYLLPFVAMRAHELCDGTYLMEVLVSACIAEGAVAQPIPYKNYKKDLQMVADFAMMSSSFWQNGKLSKSFIDNQLLIWDQNPTCAGPISAWLFFNILSLETEDIPLWLQGLLNIRDAFWQANILAFIATFPRIVPSEPFKLVCDEKSFPRIYWDGAELLLSQNIILKPERIEIVESTIRKALNIEVIFDWLKDMAGYPSVAYWFNEGRLSDEIVDKLSLL